MNEAKRPGGPAEGLREIKLAFIAAHERGEPLAMWLERYPQHARTLIDLAMALEMGKRQPAPSPEEIATASEALRGALQQVTGAPLSRPAPGFMARARALGMRAPTLAQRLRLHPTILIKLDQGFIRVDSVPRRLIEQLAAALDSSAEMVLASLPQVPHTAGAQYYADRAPEPARQESFADALAGAEGLPEADRQLWQAVLRDEGLVP
jgi:hypothetical protein